MISTLDEMINNRCITKSLDRKTCVGLNEVHQDYKWLSLPMIGHLMNFSLLRGDTAYDSFPKLL